MEPITYIHRQFTKEQIYMADKCMKRCPHLLLVREMHTKVTMRRHIMLIKVENTGTRATASIANLERVSSDVKHLNLWKSNLVTFITKLKISYPITKNFYSEKPCYRNKTHSQLTAAFFIWQKSGLRMTGHKGKNSWINSGSAIPQNRVQPFKKRSESYQMI